MTSTDKLNMTLDEIKALRLKEQKEAREKTRGGGGETKGTRERRGRGTPRTSSSGINPPKQQQTTIEVPVALDKPPLSLGTAVIVANLDAGVELDQLKEFFEDEVAPLKSIDKLRFNGRWHAARLVFKLKSEAEKAVELFDGRLLEDRPLKVSIAKKRENTSSTGSGNKKTRLSTSE